MARIHQGFSINQLAQKLGWDPRTLKKLEEEGILGEAKMVELCEALGLDVQAFMPPELQKIEMEGFQNGRKSEKN